MGIGHDRNNAPRRPRAHGPAAFQYRSFPFRQAPKTMTDWYPKRRHGDLPDGRSRRLRPRRRPCRTSRTSPPFPPTCRRQGPCRRTSCPRRRCREPRLRAAVVGGTSTGDIHRGHPPCRPARPTTEVGVPKSIRSPRYRRPASANPLGTRRTLPGLAARLAGHQPSSHQPKHYNCSSQINRHDKPDRHSIGDSSNACRGDLKPRKEPSNHDPCTASCDDRGG